METLNTKVIYVNCVYVKTVFYITHLGIVVLCNLFLSYSYFSNYIICIVFLSITHFQIITLYNLFFK